MDIRNGRELPGVWTEGAGRRFLSLLYRPEKDDIPDLAFGFVHIPSQTAATAHEHDATDEFWVIVTGTGEAVVGDERGGLKPGDVVHGPPGIPHQLINTSEDAPLEAVYILCPAGDERNVVEMMARQSPQFLE